MPEATMICCDCSEYMRNGDFHPSRFDGQADAVGLISNAKTQQNHENTVGLIAMHPNARADVLVNCTQDIGRVLSSLAKMKVGDNSLIKPPSFNDSITVDEKSTQPDATSESENDAINILVALQTAQLALKHRKNKKQDQRIILFVGSPIVKAQNEKLLIKAAKRLKKNNVSVDVVNFGESDTNTDLLERFIGAVGANDNSNLVTVPAGKLLSDVLVSTPIFAQSGQQINEYGNLGANDADLNAAIRASQADQNASGFGGVDPNTDPELAMALRMSMEEERQRQEAEAKKAAEDTDNTDANDVVQAQPQAQAQAAAAQEQAPVQAPVQAAVENKEDSGAGVGVGGDLGNMAEELGIDEEDEELLKALQMSMEENNDDDNDNDNDVQMSGGGGDDNFVDELLNDLPGMDQNDLEEIGGNMDDLLAAVDDSNDNEDNEDNEENDKEKEKSNEKKEDNK